ncbi:MAG TPA: PfkB family carbohydrate kinase, partial [Aggregatilineales bacterium]|nr:PfkB family carbohydrate kinase [Aggregatilineales bacterium]
MASPTILCVTANVALDRRVVVRGFKPGLVFRSDPPLETADGKGFNVARAVQILGAKAIGCGFVGGPTGDRVQALARAEDIECALTPIPGETRIDTIIIDAEIGEATVINEPGPAVTAGDWQRLRRDVLHESARADSVCLCGSLPTGSPADALGLLIGDLKAAGRTV